MASDVIWKSDGDSCEECASHDGEEMTRQEAKELKHPNCDCEIESVNESEGGSIVVDDDNIGKTIVEDGANGSIEDVLIAPVGDFIGSDKDGNPIRQHFTEESLSKIAENLNSENREVLMDADHQSAKEGLERNTRALGWFSKFVANAKGLFGLLRLTKWGRELIEGREYRRVSPVFTLGKEDMTPQELLSVAATNTPAIEVEENKILNQSSNEVLKMEITKEELVELIKSTVTSLNAKPTDVQQVDDASETDAPKVDEQVVDEDSEEVIPKESEEVTPKVEEVCDTQTAEPQHQEVIKEEVLNQSPKVDVEPEWRNLRGEALFEWCRKHPNVY